MVGSLSLKFRVFTVKLFGVQCRNFMATITVRRDISAIITSL